jgi:hypothetical protein
VLLSAYPSYMVDQTDVNVYAIDSSGVSTLCGNSGNYALTS